MKKIIVRRTIADAVHELPEQQHPVQRRIYLARRLRSARELECSLDSLLPHAALKGIDEAVKLLVAALHAQKRMLIVADFDADGATGGAGAGRARRRGGGRGGRGGGPGRGGGGGGRAPGSGAGAAQRRPERRSAGGN